MSKSKAVAALGGVGGAAYAVMIAGEKRAVVEKPRVEAPTMTVQVNEEVQMSGRGLLFEEDSMRLRRRMDGGR